jgi:hypothetical protein
VWSLKKDPPKKLLPMWNNRPGVHPVVNFTRHPTKSINNRFEPLTDVPHTDAIFSVDDDMRVPCAELDLAHEVWRGAQRSIVGFMPRVHLRHGDTLDYRCWWRVWWHGTYSIVLTKVALFHHHFLELYSGPKMQPVRDLVDEVRNCEDIAMQFLIANATHLPPIFVKGHLSDKGTIGGISTSSNILKASHMGQRGRCLDDLSKAFGGTPLVPSHVVVDAASNGWTNAPSTWMEYISSDLWKW